MTLLSPDAGPILSPPVPLSGSLDGGVGTTERGRGHEKAWGGGPGIPSQSSAFALRPREPEITSCKHLRQKTPNPLSLPSALAVGTRAQPPGGGPPTHRWREVARKARFHPRPPARSPDTGRLQGKARVRAAVDSLGDLIPLRAGRATVVGQPPLSITPRAPKPPRECGDAGALAGHSRGAKCWLPFPEAWATGHGRAI